MVRPSGAAAWQIPRSPAASSEAVSRSMQGNRRSDTRPEIRLRSLLHREGYRFRKDVRIVASSGVTVRADICFGRKRGIVVFVDGCFWHMCPEHGRVPDTNRAYWVPKLQRNVERDRAVDAALRSDGWKVVRLWEHRPANEAAQDVIEVLEGRA